MSDLRRIVRALQASGCLIDLPADVPDTITDIVDDSRQVRPGSLFCAMRGTVEDGHRYVDDAAARGAAVMLVTEKVETRRPQIVVRDGRAATAVAAAEFFGRPGDVLELIGVTGTNGKSTTAFLTRHLLNAKRDVGVVGTLGAFDGANRPVYREGLTTPGAVHLHSTLSDLVTRGTAKVVMEVSSHALQQRRVDGLRFRAAVFTNLTHEHLDYHSTIGEYRDAKVRLAEYVEPDGALVVNADDNAWSGLLPSTTLRRVTFGLAAAADVGAREVELLPHGTRMLLIVGEEAIAVRVPLIGAFNVSNALAAAATACAVGIDAEEVAARLADAPPIEGRMEPIVDEPFLILRDYAHTPDALQRALAAARPLTAGRLVVVFGCGGDRDRQKRSPMGQAAVRGADVVVLTSDNPRTEDPEAILDDVEDGMRGHAFVRITDRREAIGRAIALLKPGDCLVLAGKGHETYQVVGTTRRPFDERRIVRDALAVRSDP